MPWPAWLRAARGQPAPGSASTSATASSGPRAAPRPRHLRRSWRCHRRLPVARVRGSWWSSTSFRQSPLSRPSSRSSIPGPGVLPLLRLRARLVARPVLRAGRSVVRPGRALRARSPSSVCRCGLGRGPVRFHRPQRGPALASLVQAAAGHPQRLNLLAHHLWNLVPDGDEADDDAWREAKSAALAYVRPELLAVWNGIGGNHRKALRLVAWGEPLFGSAAHRLGLSGGSATAARRGAGAAQRARRARVHHRPALGVLDSPRTPEPRAEVPPRYAPQLAKPPASNASTPGCMPEAQAVSPKALALVDASLA